MRGVFLDIGTVGPGDLDLQPLTATLDDWTLLDSTPDDQIRSAIRCADILVTNKVRLDRTALAACDSAKLICVAATGTNNVDLLYAREHNITVCNIRAYATASVVEHVFSQILALTRHHEDYRIAVNGGQWQRSESFSLLTFPIRELAGQTLGIIGYGELGKAVAAMGKAFGMKILLARRPGSAPQAGRVPLEQLLSQSTVISLHCPLTASTENLIDHEAFMLMRRDALLINTARGGIVNEKALAVALRSGRIAGASIDVLSEEPPGNNYPLLDVSIPNLIVTPHIAWAGLHSRQTLIGELATNILAFMDGKPRNVVTCQG